MTIKSPDKLFSSSVLHQNLDWVAYAGVFLLLTGFLLNRVTNNIGAILIGLYTVIKIKEILPLFRHPWMISFILLGTIPLISDILSEGPGFYVERGIMKMILVLFPAFIFALKPGKKEINNFMVFFIMLMFLSTCYSLYHYIFSYGNMFLTYKQSRIVATLSLGDHIRISWATLISCIFAFYILIQNRGTLRNLMIFYIFFQVFFLHILGSKTGLISLYLTILIMIFYLLPGIKKWYLLIVLPLLLLMPLAAYKTLPSFEQRINFIKYDFEHYIKGEYKEGLSDAVRYYSLKAGKDIVSQHLLFGTGFSRLQSITNKWYQKNIPAIKSENYFLPSSEILIYWASGGILGLLIFVYHILSPIFDNTLRNSMWFMSFFIPAAVSFTFETHLEGQLPLFLYGFLSAFFWYLAYDHDGIVENVVQ